MCRKFCNNYQDAEEAAQDTFLIAFKKSTDLKADTFISYMAYLRKIAIHESFRKRRADSRRQEHFIYTDKLPENYEELDENLLPTEALQNKERNAELMQIVESLPKMQYEMIYMYYFADFTVAEIAKLMDCTPHNVRQTLYVAKKSLKDKLKGKDKKKAVIATVLVPLGTLFQLEEQVFAAAYTPAASFGGAGMAVAESVGAVATTTAKYTKICVMVAGALIIGVAATALYFALRPAVDYTVYGLYMPTYEVRTPHLDEEADCETDNTEPYTEEIETPTVDSPEQTELQEITEYELPEDWEQDEEPAQEPAQETAQETGLTVAEEPRELEPIQEEPTKPEENPPEADEPYALEPAPEPAPIDRTPEILAALAVAGTAGDVDGIISYYGFVFADQIRTSAGEQIRFYVTNEGKGDILIGIASYEDGTGWRMRFEHYNDGQMPFNTLKLFQFMDQ